MFKEIATIMPREVVDGYVAKFIHTENMTLAFWEVRAGAVMPLHHHTHEQTSQVLEGEFELTIDGNSTVFGPGFVAIIPSGVPHGGVAVTDCKLLDIFSPAREDYK